MLWLSQLVTGLTAERPGFNARPVHVGVVVNQVALGQVYIRILLFFPSVLPTDVPDSRICHQCYTITATDSISKQTHSACGTPHASYPVGIVGALCGCQVPEHDANH